MIKTSPWKGLFTLIAFLMVVPAFSQAYTSAETKSIEKSKTFYKNEKYDKAVSTITKVQNAHPHDAELWQLRVQYEYTRYQVQYYEDILAILKKAQKKGTVEVDFNALKSSQYEMELVSACYLATLYAPNQDLASSVIHDQFIKPSADTSISDEAKDLKSTGDEEYTNGNYSSAIRKYEKAIGEDSNYYGATYKMAFAYYKDEKYDKAETWFMRAIKLQPEMLDPRYYLVECYIEEKNWDMAYSACIDGMIQYPFSGYFTQMDKICDKKDKTFKLHWMERDYSPNMLNLTSQSSITDEPWSHYRSAKEKIADYCNDEGIIKKSQTITDQKYLESYSWELMLKKTETEDHEFGFARKQQEQGYLDCFSFFSMFHIAFWDQYAHFRDANHDRLKAYIETQLIK